MPIKNQKFPSDPNQAGIHAHNVLSNLYKFRPPYLKDFFNELSIKLKLSERDTVLDLCCGRGELADGVHDSVKHVFAIDGSDGMLLNAIQNSNVTFYNANVNSGILPIKEKVNNILIGTAIHWIRDYALTPILDEYLLPDGKVCMIHRSMDFDDEDFNVPLRNLNAKYQKKVDYRPDFTGYAKMQKCGFQEIKKIIIKRKIKFDLEYFYLNQLSLAYGDFQENIFLHANNYKQDFINALTPYLNDGKLSGSLTNWAIIYSKK